MKYIISKREIFLTSQLKNEQRSQRHELQQQIIWTYRKQQWKENLLSDLIHHHREITRQTKCFFMLGWLDESSRPLLIFSLSFFPLLFDGPLKLKHAILVWCQSVPYKIDSLWPPSSSWFRKAFIFLQVIPLHETHKVSSLKYYHLQLKVTFFVNFVFFFHFLLRNNSFIFFNQFFTRWGVKEFLNDLYSTLSDTCHCF